MSLPINIDELVHGHTIEWERLEFKRGWNPEDIIHSMCAFANDLHNWGGGYIILGVGEQEGQPVLPPTGLQPSQLDLTQKKILELGYKIQPNYFPVSQPYVLQGQHIIVLWCPAGDNRIYTAPTTLGNGSPREPYVRVGSNSVAARGETLRRLLELTARVPFDDRINNQASLLHLDLGLIQAYLQEVKSDLLQESTRMTFPDLCRTMLIAKGANEDLRPVNIGLLFFSKEPDRFFSRAWIELVWHKDHSGSNYKEYYFKGPLQKQLRDALSFIQANVIAEHIIKHEGKAEAERFFNFPYAAIEEALCNAVYHKSYELGSPIEVQVWPDKITILSHPGPVPPVNAKVLATYRQIIAREYRNRRIGDLLKELKLTEGRGTGLPTIYAAMAKNSSPPPAFDTDENSYVLVTLPAHDAAGTGAGNGDKKLFFNNLEEIIAFGNGARNQAPNQTGRPAIDLIVTQIHSRVVEMLDILNEKMKRADLFEQMDLSNQSKNRARYLDPLLEIGWVSMEFPEERTHPNQTYQITEAGKRILALVNQQ